MARSVLIFGGTFDPPHRGHLELPSLVADRIGCDRILYVPTSSNPLKADPPVAGHHRLAMLELALRHVPRAECTALELDAGGPSYTVDTLERLRAMYGPGVELRLLMGSDAALSFPRWRHPERILDLATPAVMLRPPHDRARFESALCSRHAPPDAERWLSWVVAVPEIPVEATEVRRRLRAGEDVSDLVPPGVRRYIAEHRLYTACRSSGARRPGDEP